MPEGNTPPTNQPTSAPPVPANPATSAAPSVPSDAPKTPASTPEAYAEVASKISEAHNVLIALSSDPSVDEMAAAIGLSLYLDKLGKRATAIYSGATPNALEFLKPEETFEPTADTLQDFVIALNKDKADHLRYKLDGDYVKIYITPYKTRIAEEDLEFSYGDFNVDLVLALDVANGIDLDSALREHGRIMHDAVIINITTGNPGKFGEIEWSDKTASSVSEMIARLLYGVRSEVKIGKEEATAFLTGIVAATNRFSNASTTPETMRIASKLMESGANQQLISKNITPDTENEMFSMLKSASTNAKGDPTNLNINHGDEAADSTDAKATSQEVDATITENNSSLLDDLKAAEASLAQAGAETTPDLSNRPVRIDEAPLPSESTSPAPTTEPAAASEPATAPAESAEPELPPVVAPEPATEPASESASESASTEASEISAPAESAAESPETPTGDSYITEAPSEKVITPPAGMDLTSEGDTDKYGRMLEEALAGLDTAAPAANPAAMTAPAVASAPEINGVPEMNYMPMPGDEVLPPPPAPPIDMSTSVAAPAPVPAPAPAPMPAEPSAPVAPNVPTMPAAAPLEPAAPAPEPTPTPLGNQPAMQDQVYAPQAADPSAFKIPGM